MPAGQNAELHRQDWASLVSGVTVALENIIPPEQLNTDWPAPDPIRPVLRAAQHRRRYLYRSALRYGDAPQHVLDIWRREDLPSGPAPVLVFVPGGAWVYGKRILQGYALMSHLAEQGWLCVAIDHRAGPGHRWPRHVQDVRMAVEWVRSNVDQFGGDPTFVAIAGASSGAHLAALSALAHDDPDYGVESTRDASVDAVIALYGRYDWEDMSTRRDKGVVQFLERIVVGKRMKHHPHVFRNASPIARVRPDAPPFLVVHGTADRFVPVERARAFVEKLPVDVAGPGLLSGIARCPALLRRDRRNPHRHRGDRHPPIPRRDSSNPPVGQCPRGLTEAVRLTNRMRTMRCSGGDTVEAVVLVIGAARLRPRCPLDFNQ